MCKRFHVSLRTALFLWLTTLVEGTCNDTLSLNDCIQAGLRSHPYVRALECRVKQAAARIKEARAGFFPDVAFRGEYEDVRNEKREPYDVTVSRQGRITKSVGMDQTLFTGFQVLGLVKQTRVEHQIATLQLKSTEIALAILICDAYLGYCRACADTIVFMGTVERLGTQREVVQAYCEQELKPAIDLLRVDVELARAAGQLDQARNRVKIRRAVLSELLQLEPQKTYVFRNDLTDSIPAVPVSLESCIEAAYENKPRILIAEKRIDAAGHGIRMAWGEALPEVGVSVSYVLQDIDYHNTTGLTDNERTYWYGALRMSLPVFSGGSRYYVCKQRIQEKKEYEYRLLSEKSELRTEITTAFIELLDAMERAPTAEKIYKEAREAQKIARARYKTDIGTLTELLEAEEHVTRALQNSNEVRIQSWSKLTHLYAAMGDTLLFSLNAAGLRNLGHR
ncbi:MAG: hypothetical protein GF344_20585 [Chitinivibrionales bacterium]|nr:hypothetical protein [Chitinivibrionales bacterium]MBD3358995.1 hypothetical protein [Chitinivibrionales bacterium]